MKNLLLCAAVLLFASCRTTYPEACELSTKDGVRAWRCNCKQVKISVDGGPAPAGVITWKCDGAKLPLTIATDNVGLPKCQ